MELRVLGPLEVLGDDGPVSVGGPVPRRVLCALVSRPGVVVPMDALVDAAWGDEPPASAERTLQSHLTRIRESLAAANGHAPLSLERGEGGYRLTASGDAIDAARFETAVDAARYVPPAEAVAGLREALALWRTSTPYADLQDTAYPAAQAARLVEMRGAAADALAGALLDAGDAESAAAEAEARLQDDPYRERLWEVLVVALYRQGRQADALAAYRRASHELDEGLGVEPGPRLRELESQVLAQDPSLLRRSAQARRPCPYKGLARYDVDDSDLYVGREQLVEEVLGRLVDARFLVVVGPSGAGKSSFVRAGLVPALRDGALPGSADWSVTVVTPGSDPVGALAAGGEADVLVVDQAEEALLADDGAHVEAFGDAVLTAVDAGRRVVLALRADFYGRLAEHPGLARRAGPATVLVAPPDDDELRRIVVEPAARVGLTVEPALADLVVAEVRGRPGVLPVLSTALVRTWEHRDGDRLTVASYRAGGGVEAALQRVGEEAWAALESEAQRAACRRMLLRLAVDEDGSWVRRRTRRSEVAPADDVDAVAALAVLTDRRLVVARADDLDIAHESLLTGWPRLYGWLEDGRAHAEVRERLAAAATSWATDDHDPAELYAGTRLQAALDTAAASPDDLTPGEREFLTASSAQADRELREQRSRADREAQGRRRIRAVAAGLAAALVLAAVAGGFAVSKERAAQTAADDSRQTALAADANRLGTLARTGGEYDLSLLLAAQAVTMAPSSSSESDLFATLLRGDAATAVQRAPDVPQDFTFSRDGKNLLGIVKGDLVTWPVGGGPPTSVAHLDRSSSPPDHLQEMPDGTVAVDRDDHLVIVDPRTGGASSVLGLGVGLWVGDPDLHTFVASMLNDGANSDADAIWTDGNHYQTIHAGWQIQAVVRCGQDTACLTTWDHGSRGRLFRIRLSDGTVETSYSIDGARFNTLVGQARSNNAAILWGDGTIRVFDTRTGADLAAVPGGTRDPVPLAFSPDGESLVTSDFDVALLWHWRDYNAPQRFVGHNGAVQFARFSPDGRDLVTSGSDKTLITWDLSGTTSLSRVVTTGFDDPATTLWPVGSQVAIGQQDGVLRFVDLVSGALTAAGGTDPLAGAHDMPTARSGRRGTLMVVVDDGGRTAVVDTVTRRWTGTVDLATAATGYPGYAWVSPDGRLGASIRNAVGPVVFDLATRAVVRQLPPLPPTPDEETEVEVQGWSADGSALLVTRTTGKKADLVVMDATTGQTRFVVDLEGRPAYEAVADPAGRFIAAGLATGEVEILDPHDGHELVPPLPAIPGSVSNVSVSPDGRYLSVSGNPADVTVWDTRDFRQVGTALPLDVGVQGVRARFAADGSLVVTSGSTMRDFVIDPNAWLARACATAGRILTRDEWARYLPGRPYAPTCTARR